MAASGSTGGTIPAAHGFADLPPPRIEPGARQRIRASHAKHGRRIAVVDDDPTGSQNMHGVAVVTVLEDTEFASALDAPGSCAFLLTNSRSMPEPEAATLNAAIGRRLHHLAARLGAPVEIVSRSDSTLRGHLRAEVGALTEARREVTGRGYDGVLVVPAYFDAGRCTAGDVHWARVGGELLPVGETEYARDATFGYSASNLCEWVAEKSAGTVRPADVHSLSIEDIRLGGPARVAEVLTAVSDGAFVVVNCLEDADLDVVVLGLLDAEAAGRSFLHRTAPSFVRALTGLDPQPPLTSAQLRDAGRKAGPNATHPTATSHGLVVVGSHVGLTSRQVAAARGRGGFKEVDLDVTAVIDPTRRDGHVATVTARVVTALQNADVLLATSRTLSRGHDALSSLDIARTVSAAVVDVVRGARAAAAPAWYVAKGGITSHDVAVRALEIRRAEVAGQLFDGMVSVWRPLRAAPEVIEVPYVVFAGNVGDENTLAEVVDTLRGSR
ncbi:four-carbon acid sugar kinase family protein [Actinopolymorpha sp. B9G3]|uniref:four-carbon acid sugar kinase family protein n=1 Tax=Actinopolymorpha sp. B9G3 TaxID=3158970 RepID=UPI0032D94647